MFAVQTHVHYAQVGQTLKGMCRRSRFRFPAGQTSNGVAFGFRLIRKENIVVSEGIDDYGMVLRRQEEVDNFDYDYNEAF